MANAPIIGENSKPRLWAGSSLRGYGLNAYGEHLFRVVWGPSRLWLIGGVWEEHHDMRPTDQELALNGRDLSFVRKVREYRWVPKYPEAWILERWLTPEQYGGTPKQWLLTQMDYDAKLLTLGPYPERGEYEMCYAFPSEPSYSAITGVIDMLIYGSKYTQDERKRAIQAGLDGKKWDWKNKCEAIFRDSQGAFNNRASNVNPAKRTADKVRLDKSAEELGLQVLPEKFFTNKDDMPEWNKKGKVQ